MFNKAAYTSLILFIPKLNGGWRFCVNYQKLNRIIIKDKYLFSLIKKIFRRIIKARVFIKLDI